MRGHRTSVATRLSVAVLAVAITAIVLSVLASTENVSGSADSLRESQVLGRSTAMSDDLEAYVRNKDGGARRLASSPAMAAALEAFADAFGELDAADLDSLVPQREAVASFYLDDFLPQLAEVRGQKVDPLDFAQGNSSAFFYLQSVYIAENPFAADERALLSDPGDGSTYSTVHARAHPALRTQIDLLGFDDLYLIDAASKAVVYSTNKAVEFATDLSSGPHSDSTLAGLVRSVLGDPQPGVVAHADFAVYPPALDRPTAFFAAPIFDEGGVSGVVALSIDDDDLAGILTRDWRDDRLGETGETYLVGADKTMRSDSRFFVEDKASYLQRLAELGTVPDEDLERMRALDTTVVFQPVDNDAVRQGLSGERGTATVTNYLGDEVLSSYAPVAAGSFDWVLMVDQGLSELEEGFSDYIRTILVITVVFVVALTFAAVAWASSFTAPLRTMSAALARIRTTGDIEEIPVTGTREFRALASQLDHMGDRLGERREAVLRALRTKSALLRTLLPSSAARQVARGDRRLAESLPDASVVVVVMGRLDELFTTGDLDANRAFLHGLVDRLDSLARAHGLERVKVIGDSFFAVTESRMSTLDHAPRAVVMAEAALAEIDRSAGDAGIDIAPAAGVATGPITAGLVGSSKLVYDVWGAAVDDAYELGHAARRGTVVVTQPTRERLPSGGELSEVRVGSSIAWEIDPSSPTAAAAP